MCMRDSDCGQLAGRACFAGICTQKHTKMTDEAEADKGFNGTQQVLDYPNGDEMQTPQNSDNSTLSRSE